MDEEAAGKADSLYKVCGGARTSRMFEGNVVAVGVDGSTFTDVWGDRPVFMFEELLWVEGKAEEWTELDVEEVDEALECVCTWWMLRMEETEEEVDLRPRSPAEEWR